MIFSNLIWLVSELTWKSLLVISITARAPHCVRFRHVRFIIYTLFYILPYLTLKSLIKFWVFNELAVLLLLKTTAISNVIYSIRNAKKQPEHKILSSNRGGCGRSDQSKPTLSHKQFLVQSSTIDFRRNRVGFVVTSTIWLLSIIYLGLGIIC